MPRKEMSKYIPLTNEENKAIRALKKLEAIWPRSLWLFSASGSLCVMKKNADGEQAFRETARGDGVDQAFIVATIDIENDGGDW
jgi:hypothetical protein